MGLYSVKDYFTFDDVASYLNDLGICQFNIIDDNQANVLKTHLLGFVSEKKITPVFLGWALSKTQIDQIGIEQAKAILDNPKLSDDPIEQINTIKDNNLYRGYFCLDISQYKNLIKFDNLYINHYAPYYEKLPDIGDFDY
ncbi:Uncharacterised protein [Moraxella caprae]|uniref:Uncharacterized protein n=1 Tax=Moraxella caprae TaxID=90240 RepID=A0A378QYC2_9GAMM|nr:hypothetical protein [Moraxella caprae]STZ08036.1 Uncharacterised protein [Moraxella caprae]